MVFELFTDESWNDQYKKFTALSKFPTMRRELAFVMPEEVTVQSIVEQISSSHTDIRDVVFLDIFRDDEKV